MQDCNLHGVCVYINEVFLFIYSRLIGEDLLFTVPEIVRVKTMIAFQDDSVRPAMWRRGLILRTDGKNGALTVSYYFFSRFSIYHYLYGIHRIILTDNVHASFFMF